MEYLTVDGEFEAKYEIFRSVFICSVKGINSFEEGIEFCKSISHKYSEATHNCYAVIEISGEQKFSDDGEPQGTAGQPILQVIKKRNLTNVAVVVTRYFGGIKLGAGGLVSAYTQSVIEGLAVSRTVKKTQSSVGRVILDYNEYALFNAYIKNSNYLALNTIYNDNVELTFALPKENGDQAENKLSLISSGKKFIDWQDDCFYTYE